MLRWKNNLGPYSIYSSKCIEVSFNNDKNRVAVLLLNLNLNGNISGTQQCCVSLKEIVLKILLSWEDILTTLVVNSFLVKWGEEI